MEIRALNNVFQVHLVQRTRAMREDAEEERMRQLKRREEEKAKKVKSFKDLM